MQTIERITVQEYRMLLADLAKQRRGKHARGRAHKYGAKPQRVDGHYFGSTFEAKRYGILKMLQLAGEITKLKLQPRFPLTSVGEDVGVMVADFSYTEKQRPNVLVVEDTKGVVLPLYTLKRRLFQAQYPQHDFREIKQK